MLPIAEPVVLKMSAYRMQHCASLLWLWDTAQMNQIWRQQYGR